jgi:thiol:disulfide interchange protein DsbD
MKRVLVLMFVVSASIVLGQDTSGVNFTPINTDSPVAASVTPTSTIQAEKSAGTPRTGNAHDRLWMIFLEGLAGGFAALLMPCIFPMLPMTVSFFTKGQDKGKGVGRAMLYGASIIGIYVSLGLVVTVLFGADAMNNLSTNGIFNFCFFLLLVVFAGSFLGGFELTLPSGVVNRLSSKAGGSGVAGIFFMAATLAVVSFSCTGPIIGTLLVQTATTGAVIAPAIGMFGFSLALALPFTLFALFPGWMQQLPRSGGWLNSVKVVLGFLELALALKFLSNVDLAYHWHWFDREVFLVLWIAIFGLMGLYLLGKIPFGHDNPVSHMSVPRLFSSIIVFSFTMYLVPGLWGAPLKAVSAFIPPMATQDFDLSVTYEGGLAGVGPQRAHVNDSDVVPHKYVDLFDRPKGFHPFFDFDEAVAAAKRSRMPVMVDFTGHACVNCRKMEANVWTEPQVHDRINGDYVLVQLYVDDKTDLAEKDKVTTATGRELTTIGAKWSYLQTSKFGANSQPYYVLLDPATGEPLVLPQGANYDAIEYLKYLDSGLAAFKNKMK